MGKHALRPIATSREVPARNESRNLGRGKMTKTRPWRIAFINRLRLLRRRRRIVNATLAHRGERGINSRVISIVARRCWRRSVKGLVRFLARILTVTILVRQVGDRVLS